MSSNSTDGSQLSSPLSLEHVDASDMESVSSSAILFPNNHHSTPLVADRSDDATGSVASHRAPLVDHGHEMTEEAQVAALKPRRERFFFTSDFLVFKVQGQVYRVHGYLFATHSPQWAERLAATGYDGIPIQLDHLSSDDMDAFLSMLYPTTLASHDAQTYEEWAAILRLANEWQFGVIRTLAIAQFDQLASPIEKLVLGRENGVSRWIHPAFVAICMRPGPLTLLEAKMLSLEDLVQITSAREALRLDRIGHPTEHEAAAYVDCHIEQSREYVDSLEHAEQIATDDSTPEPSDVESDSMAAGLSVPPTNEERRALAIRLSDYDYAGSLTVLKHHNVNTFCQALMHLSPVLTNPWRAQCLMRAVLYRGATRPEFIQLGVDLLVAIFRMLRENGRTSHRERRYITEDNIKKALQDCVSPLKTVWDGMEGAISTYDDFGLGLWHATSTCRYDFEKIVGPVNGLDRQPRVFKERSDNLRAFVVALTQAGLVAQSESDVIESQARSNERVA